MVLIPTLSDRSLVVGLEVGSVLSHRLAGDTLRSFELVLGTNGVVSLRITVSLQALHDELKATAFSRILRTKRSWCATITEQRLVVDAADLLLGSFWKSLSELGSEKTIGHAHAEPGADPSIQALEVIAV